MKTWLLHPVVACALVSICAPSARAFTAHEPGSLLVFPEFDNRSGQITFLTLTNTNADQVTGSVKVHLIYVNAANCQQTNRNENLSPRDTATFLSNFHVPALPRGYMYAYAQHASSGQSIDFDHLIGNAVRIDARLASHYSVNPFVFQALTGPGTSTDVNPQNGKPDLNGLEYDRAPNKLYVPRFFGQSPPPFVPGTYASDLVLFQPLVGVGVTTTVDFLIYNDNEEAFSAQDPFVCWGRKSLLSISGIFAESFLDTTNDDPNEVATLAIESGWYQVRGSTASTPILGFQIDLRPDGNADLPFFEDL